MKDVRIQFSGSPATCFDFTRAVEGKSLYEQKYLINTATSKNTDYIFPDRGTNLLRDAINGVMISNNEALHSGNFAALDTLYFCSYEEDPGVYNSDEYVQQYKLMPAFYDHYKRSISFRASFEFKDETSTSDDFKIQSTKD